MDKKKYANILTHQADSNKRPHEMALSDFLDFLIEFHDIKHFREGFDSWAQNVTDSKDAHPEYFSLMMDWMNDVTKAMEQGHWLDTFGSIYEELYLSRGKAISKGQFFTPPDVSDLMSQIVMNRKPEIQEGKVNDCAAGSGRLLLSHFNEVSNHGDRAAGRHFWYEAGDSDPIACKMCALNMMIHGMQGRVVCQNTLTLDTPKVIYYINEVRYPIATPYYSIRQIIPEQKTEK